MQRIWAPWRIGYVAGERPDGCVFCLKIEEGSDESNQILFRGEQNVVMLNTYPYNSGHLMVVPHAHVEGLEDLSQEATYELWDLTELAVRTVKKALHAHGVNIGMNLGAAAGAGISDHVHLHIVPRWAGDTNFMAAVTDTRVVPQSLEDSYRQLKPVMDELAAQERP